MKIFACTLCCLLTAYVFSMSGGRPAPRSIYRSTPEPAGKNSRVPDSRSVRKAEPSRDPGVRRAPVAPGSPAGVSTPAKNTPPPSGVQRRSPDTPSAPESPDSGRGKTPAGGDMTPPKRPKETRPGHARTVYRHDRGVQDDRVISPAEPPEKRNDPSPVSQGKRIVEKKSRSGR